MPRCLLAAFIAIACASLPNQAAASQTVKLQTSFSPDRLGASTTIGFSFQISSSTGQLPSPLRHIALHLPARMDYLTTTLGLAICKPALLVADGVAGCPSNSRIGSGSAYVELPFGAENAEETPEIVAFMGPPSHGEISVLFYTIGHTPVSAQILFQSTLSEGSESKGGTLSTPVPLVPALPNGSPVSIIRVKATIGPAHLLYEKREHGHVVHFRPQGVGVPETCPRGGFPFSAQFGFQDGSNATASSTVPCPTSK